MVLDFNLLFNQIGSINAKIEALQESLANQDHVSKRRIVDINGLISEYPQLGVKSTIYKLTSSGHIPHFKRNGKLLFDLDVIEEYAYPSETK
jgi:hypothetical protein